MTRLALEMCADSDDPHAFARDYPWSMYREVDLSTPPRAPSQGFAAYLAAKYAPDEPK